MTHSGGDDGSENILEGVVTGLSEGGGSRVDDGGFMPQRKESVDGNLPGRQRGTNLAKAPSPTAGPAAVVLECGTSRRQDFTHVLLISSTAPEVLGEHQASRLGEVINTIDGVDGFEWESGTHLHLRAPDFSHESLLGAARVIVAQMLA